MWPVFKVTTLAFSVCNFQPAFVFLAGISILQDVEISTSCCLLFRPGIPVIFSFKDLLSPAVKNLQIPFSGGYILRLERVVFAVVVWGDVVGIVYRRTVIQFG